MFAFVWHRVQRRARRREYFHLSRESILGMDVVGAELVLRPRGRKRRTKALNALSVELKSLGVRNVILRDDFIMKDELLRLGFYEPDGAAVYFELAPEQALWSCGGSRSCTVAFYADRLGADERRLLFRLADTFRHILVGVEQGGRTVDAISREMGIAVSARPSLSQLREADCAVMAEGGRVTVLDASGEELAPPSYEIRGVGERDVPSGFDRDVVVSEAVRTGKLRRELLKYVPPGAMSAKIDYA